jgi:hypothetical protein
MNQNNKILGTQEAWESGQLGADEKYVRTASVMVNEELDTMLGLEVVTIRMEKHVVDAFRLLAIKKRVHYQSLIRYALQRYFE